MIVSVFENSDGFHSAGSLAIRVRESLLRLDSQDSQTGKTAASCSVAYRTKCWVGVAQIGGLTLGILDP